MELSKRLKSGVYGGIEYAGEVVENNGIFTATIIEIPRDQQLDHTEESGYQDTKQFDSFAAASDYVISEWKAKFGE